MVQPLISQRCVSTLHSYVYSTAVMDVTGLDGLATARDDAHESIGLVQPRLG